MAGLATLVPNAKRQEMQRNRASRSPMPATQNGMFCQGGKVRARWVGGKAAAAAAALVKSRRSQLSELAWRHHVSVASVVPQTLHGGRWGLAERKPWQVAACERCPPWSLAQSGYPPQHRESMPAVQGRRAAASALVPRQVCCPRLPGAPSGAVPPLTVTAPFCACVSSPAAPWRGPCAAGATRSSLPHLTEQPCRALGLGEECLLKGETRPC